MCEAICKQSGGLAEALLVLLVGARALYSEWRSRQLKQTNSALSAKVEQLSIAPPASSPPVVLQLAAHPSLASLVPVALPPAQPAAAAEAPPAPDPDHEDPPRSGY